MINLSYILPVYGVERYIAECLDSIYSQGLPESEFEVICVDDCSPDNSKEIIRSYQKKHANLILVEHSINKKSGGARNTGIKKAQGKYIWLIDPDDLIAPNAANRIIEECEKYNLDVLCFNFSIFSDKGKKPDSCFKQPIAVINGTSFLENVFGDKIIYNLGYPWRAVYQRDVVLNNQIAFAENLSYGEETTFMAEVISSSEWVATITDDLYYYRQNETNVTYYLKQGKGDLIYYSIISAAELVLKWKLIISERSNKLETNIDSGLPWFVNRLFIRLIRTSPSQRAVFYQCLLKDAKNGKQHDALYSYMDFKNRFIVKHPKMGKMALDILSVVYKCKHR